MLPNVATMKISASDMPTSPTRFTTNAFFAATAADGFWYQKPISRYDARPTPSQPTYSTRKSSASTSRSIAATKKLR